MLCYLLDCMMNPENVPQDSCKDVYEMYFMFACIWAFGGCLFQDQLGDGRTEFTKWWMTEIKGVKFPTTGTLFDYYIDHDQKKWEPWTKKMVPFEFDPDVPLQVRHRW